MIEGQQGLIPEIVKSKTKKMGHASHNGGYSGFPLKFFECESYLQRLSDWFINAPVYLAKNKLQGNKNPVFRLNQCVLMVLSTLYMTVKPSKPFNPILGETFQGHITKLNSEGKPDLEFDDCFAVFGE